ncbi:acyl carrier protein [Streptomyces sp. AV19]|uniref:acyl carrier protein n=1 Tax=Streptomyces sp. AV19 TaxID=2793068 RepID=UPI0018FE5E54|nr:phosphopantetheine-binding protein [Streptomyces sp. AV19]MBH1937203.1 acyl carrier protein [Streptomyces sp. AV19]MDG4533476.1 phosphopantetheine-binding protein [Streptomyces sp. AV19]
MTHADLRKRAEERTALNQRLKTLLVDNLELATPAEEIGDDQPLFGRGLELDSLDTLEIVVMVEENFGVSISDDDSGVFGSVNKLADFIIEQGGIIEQAGEIPAVESV